MDDRRQAPNSELDVIWGADAIARAIGRSAATVNAMLPKGALPGARKVGGRWCITRRALLAAFEDAPASQVQR